MRFIHTADWQLGKPFGRFDAETRAALTEARFDVIDTLGRAAVEHGAGHILVAGDVFDTEGPDERTVVQAVTRMERHACRWWLLPGNHDFARNGGIWDRVQRRAAANVTVLTAPAAHEIADGVWLLPAPLLHRHTLDDPTEVFARMETPGARLRIGLAHGSIRGFGTQGETKNMIAPDRARLSNLDYLALGDWHGTLQVDARTWYCGTPRPTGFSLAGTSRDRHCWSISCPTRPPSSRSPPGASVGCRVTGPSRTRSASRRSSTTCWRRASLPPRFCA
ncbi:exonuclease SbcCD subunit D [Novosphingobium panipatense]